MARRAHRPKGNWYHAKVHYDGFAPESCRCNFEDYITAEDPEGKVGALAACKAFVADCLKHPSLEHWTIMTNGGHMVVNGG